MLIWHEQYSTGSPAIDEQHRELIRRLNRFESLLVVTNPTSEDMVMMTDSLDFLEYYIDLHFQYEEQCMEQYRCPAHQQNKDAHQEFRQLFKRFKSNTAKEGFQIRMLLEINESINAWIQEHILQIDTQLKPCFARKPKPG